MNMCLSYYCRQLYNTDHKTMYSTTIIDLPTEVIDSFIFPFLTDVDIRHFGKIGIKRFEDIANEYLIDNKCK